MQALEQKYKKLNTKAQTYANIHWVIFIHDQLTWPSPILVGSSLIPSNGAIIGQSFNLSPIYKNAHLR